MKKVLLFVAVATAVSFASCKKDRTCSCVTSSNAPGDVASTEVTVWKETKKGDAKDACRSYTEQTTAPVSGYTTTVDCTLN